MAKVEAVPNGLHTVTTQLSVDGAAAAIELYQLAFGAEERSRALDPSGKKIWHAEVRIGDTTLFINDTFPEMGGQARSADLWLYSEQADELFQRAEAAGMMVKFPMGDQFWGDRTGTLTDRWGNHWNLARRIRNLTAQEMKQAGEDFARAQPTP
jgi:uncharacterized glyoxalase superfamily protein PhnB